MSSNVLKNICVNFCDTTMSTFTLQAQHKSRINKNTISDITKSLKKCSLLNTGKHNVAYCFPIIHCYVPGSYFVLKLLINDILLLIYAKILVDISYNSIV